MKDLPLRDIAVGCIYGAVGMAVIGGISRLSLTPIIVNSRVWAGAAAILLLVAIAVNTLPGDAKDDKGPKRRK